MAAVSRANMNPDENKGWSNASVLKNKYIWKYSKESVCGGLMNDYETVSKQNKIEKSFFTLSLKVRENLWCFHFILFTRSQLAI